MTIQETKEETKNDKTYGSILKEQERLTKVCLFWISVLIVGFTIGISLLQVKTII